MADKFNLFFEAMTLNSSEVDGLSLAQEEGRSENLFFS